MAQVATKSPRQQIAAIDKLIDGARLELHRRVGKFNRLDASAWQLAWDRNPDLQSRERELLRQRGEAQRKRAMADHQAFMRSKPRTARVKKCPTCGGHTLLAA